MKDMELNVGGTKIKGVWIAILLSFSSTIGGGIWAASEFFSRLEQLENSVASSKGGLGNVSSDFTQLSEETKDSLNSFNIRVTTLSQQLEDNNVSALQGKLAELGTNLLNISEQQKNLLALREVVAEMSTSVAESTLIVQQAEKESSKYSDRMQVLEAEIEDLWKGLDAVTNPLSAQ